ncbi:hypothetical protein HYT33_00655 [Candidatus Roizmanbacteria bacterium]|nr:hypothetical protein [Candidatus Roizmanbacteria bacterium]
MPPKKNLWFDRLTILSIVEGKLSAVWLRRVFRIFSREDFLAAAGGEMRSD